MEFKWFNPSQPNSSPPDPTGWQRQWHGYFQMEKVRSKEFSTRVAKSHKDGTEITDEANVKRLTESEFERELFLNIIHDSPGEHLTMLELGAGRGDWCLALAGVIDHQVIPTTAKSYRCIAVEAEPTHYEWTKEHFDRQDLNAEAIWGAAYSYNGECWISAQLKPENHYGQSIREGGNVAVPCYTIREIMRQKDITRIDILHMDVQGAEVDVLLECVDLFAKGAIRYLMIGTHDPSFNPLIRKLLGEFVEFFVDHLPKIGPVDTLFGPANLPVDGMLLGKSKVPERKMTSFDEIKPIFNMKIQGMPRRSTLPGHVKSMPFTHLERSVQAYQEKDQNLEACRLIRRWTAQRIMRQIVPTGEINVETPFDYMRQGFENGTLTMLCGGTAIFLGTMYAHFGYSSAALDFGAQVNGMTHVLNLVETIHKGNPITLIQDAYINAEYGVAGFEPTDFCRFLVSLVLQRQNFKLVDHHPDDCRSFLAFGKEDKDNADPFIVSETMFDSIWFDRENNSLGKSYISASLNKPETDIVVQDMFLFPRSVAIYNNSKALTKAITFYEYQVPILRQFLINPEKYTEDDYRALEDSLKLMN